jgi:hypothetical protein
MDALCTALECTPNDLWKFTATGFKNTRSKDREKDLKVVNGKLPPL